MTIADTIHVELKTSCLPSAGCNVWCRVVEQDVAMSTCGVAETLSLATAVTSAVASAAASCCSVFGSGAMPAVVPAVAACMYLGSRRASCRPPYGTAKCASE
jgi:hypothetical protein